MKSQILLKIYGPFQGEGPQTDEKDRPMWLSWSCTILLLKVIDGDDILQESSNKSQAFAYVWSDKNDPNLYGEWDFEVNMLYFIFLKIFFA
jgi:hypothetical protein